MANQNRIVARGLLGGLLAASLWTAAAEAMSINRCVRLARDGVGNETLVNICSACVVAKVERRRPGNDSRTPTMRDFTIPTGSQQPLPFRGPGKTRILSETPCEGLPR